MLVISVEEEKEVELEEIKLEEAEVNEEETAGEPSDPPLLSKDVIAGENGDNELEDWLGKICSNLSLAVGIFVLLLAIFVVQVH